MNKTYGIFERNGHLVMRNGKPAIYATRELAKKDLQSMPASLLQYAHYEILEINGILSEDDLLFYERG